MAIVSNPNGLRAVTGGQAGTMDIQFVLIKCYNSAFTLTPTQPAPPNPVDNYEFISNSNDGLAQVVAVVQDFAEIYYIGWPEANSGGENDLTRIVIGVNPFSARGLDSTATTFPTATGRWTDLETALNEQISNSDAEAWFAMPGVGWSWAYNQ